MTITEFRGKVEASVDNLLKLAGESANHSISSNCLFILTEIQPLEVGLLNRLKQRKEANEKKQPRTLQEVISQLESEFGNLFDVALHIYHAKKHHTIIEISYFLKSALEPVYREKVADNAPMVHCKVAIPPWDNQNEKFSINWERNITALYLRMWRLRFTNLRT